MEVAIVEQANELLGKANANLEPELLAAADARALLAATAEPRDWLRSGLLHWRAN